MVATQSAAAGKTVARIAPLEGVRGIMAWWVVIGHIAHTVGRELFLISNNQLAVQVFIILSGFVITSLILNKQEPYPSYIIRRGFRIFPAYLVVLIVSAILLPLYAHAMLDIPFQTIRNISRLEQAQSALNNLPAHLAPHIFLLQGLVPNSILPGSAYTIVGQAWSVSLEWQFYLVAPFVVLGIGRRKFWPFVAIVLIGLLALRPFMSAAYLGAAVFPFGVGIASYYLYSGAGRVQLMAGVATVIFAAAGIVSEGYLQVIPLTIWGSTLLVIMTAQRLRAASVAYALLSSAPLRYIGDRSYSVYMVHMIPLYLGVYILNNAELTPPAYGVSLLIMVIFGTLILAEISYRGIERPFIKYGSRIARKLTPASLHAA